MRGESCAVVLGRGLCQEPCKYLASKVMKVAHFRPFSFCSKSGSHVTVLCQAACRLSHACVCTCICIIIK